MCYQRAMRWPNQKIFLPFPVRSFLFALSFLRAHNFLTTWVKTALTSNIFTGRVIGIADGDTISVMLEIEALRHLLFENVIITKDEFIAKFKKLDMKMKRRRGR